MEGAMTLNFHDFNLRHPFAGQAPDPMTRLDYIPEKLISREEIQKAMAEYFARGGTIKVIHPWEPKQHN
jgi:hypothetical protein